jgi:hypothetical protein
MDDVDQIANAAHLHGKFMKEVNHVESNRQYDKLMLMISEIRLLPDRGKNVLFSLMKSDDDFVKLFAATYLLPLSADVASDELEKLAKKGEAASFDAGMVLKEWRSGRLILELR